MPPGRRLPLTALLAVLVVVAAGVAAGLAWVVDRPSELDRFYRVPDADVVAAAERGAVLREMSFDTGSLGAVAHRVLYRTVGVDGAPVAASGFVAWPAGRWPEGGFPIVAVGHPTVGLADGCAPSRQGLGTLDRRQVEAFLEAGFAVAGADYPGLGVDGPHPYLVGETTGASVLDVVRAARHRAGERLGDRVVAWGDSQGGHAVLWARARAAAEAPELDWRGTVALAPAVDLRRVAADGELGDLLGVAVALGQATKGLDVDPLLTEAGRAAARDLERECFGPALVRAQGRGEPLLVDGPSGAWLDAAAADAPPAEGAGPALVLWGAEDDVVGAAEVRAWVEAAGPDVTGRELPGLHHGGLADATWDQVLPWLQARVAD